MTDATPKDAKPYPPADKGWILVIALTTAYVFSYADRKIIELLIEPIKADLNLSDEQIGWILGPAFSIVYATSGLFIGWLVDRVRRTWLVGIGIAFWSVATALSGVAQNFWQMFMARMSVGAGEATLSPAAFSMIGDSFPPEERGKPIAFYTMALTIGAAAASFLGGGILIWAKNTQAIDIPIIGTLAPWQTAFFMIGIPGLLVAAWFFFLGEPERRLTTIEDDSLKGNDMSDALGYVARHWGTYLGYVSLICTMTIIAYSQGYLPSTFKRVWGWETEYYAFVNATAILALGPANILLWGFLSDRWTQAGMRDAPLRILIAGFLIMVPTGAIAMLMPSGWTVYAVLCVNTIGIGMVSCIGVTGLLLITPAQIRGQVVALYYMTISMAGLWLGPPTVGILSSRVFGEDNLNLAVGTVPILFGLIPFLLIPITRRLYIAQMNRLDASTVSEEADA
ncbi:MAG: MFS transporter [Hyphomonas sp.]|nr:MFS transporter [Hyphomonas sp.]